MNPVLFIIIFLVVIVLIYKKVIQPLIEKNDQKQAQKSIDANTEWQLNEIGFAGVTIEMLARHSDKEKIARTVSSRIVDYLNLAIHPRQLSKILQNLGLFTAVRNNWSNKEIELSALIQQYILRDVSAHDLGVYQTIVCEDKKKGFEELNQSFLTKVHNDMLVWSLKYN